MKTADKNWLLTQSTTTDSLLSFENTRLIRGILSWLGVASGVCTIFAIAEVVSTQAVWQLWVTAIVLFLCSCGYILAFYRSKIGDNRTASYLTMAGIIAPLLTIGILFADFIIVLGIFTILITLLAGTLFSSREGVGITVVFMTAIGVLVVLNNLHLYTPAIRLGNQAKEAIAILALGITIIIGTYIVKLNRQGIHLFLQELALKTDAIVKSTEAAKLANSRLEETAKRASNLASRLQVASEITRDAATTPELDILLERFVYLISERMNYYFTGIFLVDEQREYAVIRAATGEAGRVLMQRGFKLKVGGVGVIGYVTNAGMRRIVNDVSTDFVYLKNSLLPNTRSEMGLPLKIGTQIIGALDMQSDKVNAFEEDDITALQTLADQLSLVIENNRLNEEVQKINKETNLLYQRYAQETWARAVKSRTSIGYEYNLSQVVPTTRPLTQDILTRLQANRATIIRKQQENDQEEGGTMLVAPLVMYGQMVGVLGFEENDPTHPWSSEETNILDSVSNQVALALDNARLLEETQLRTEQIRLLQQITATAASYINLKELLDAITQRILVGFDLSHCAATLNDPDGKNSTIISYTSAPGTPGADLTGIKIPQEENEVTNQVIQTRKPVVVHDIQSEPALGPIRGIIEAGTNTLVIVPLLSRGEVIGFLNLESADTQRQFDEDELRLLEQVGLQTAAGIEVSRSFEQTVRRAEHERRISEVTSRIRETLDVESIVKTTVRELQQTLGLPEVVIRLGAPALPTSPGN